MALTCIPVDVDTADLALIKEAAERRGVTEAQLMTEAVHRTAMAHRCWSEPFFSRTFAGSGRTPTKQDVRDAVADAVMRKRQVRGGPGAE